MRNKLFFLEKHMRLQIRDILRNYKLRIMLFSFLSLVHIVAVFAVPLISGYLVDNVLQEKSVEKVIFGVSVSFFVVLLSPLSNLLKNKVSVNLSLEITKEIRIEMFGKVVDAPMEELDRNKKGTILSKFINDSKEIANFTVNYYVDMVSNILLIIIIFVGMIYTSFEMSIILIISFFIYYILSSVLNRKFSVYYSAMQNKQDEFSTVINQTLDGIVTIKTNNLQSYVMEQYKEVVEDISKFNSKICNLSIWVGNFSNIYTAFATSLIYGIGAFLVLRGNMTVGAVISIGLFFQTMSAPVAKIVELDSTQKSKRPIFQRIKEMLGMEKEKVESKIAVNCINEIAFEDVSFTYNAEKQNALNNIHMKMDAPGLYGFIGNSGAGKSTLVKLLLNLYKPETGRILINGTNCADIGRKVISSIMSYAPQEPYILNDSVMNNIKCCNKAITDEMVVEICKALDLDNKINKLPNGYFTILNEKTNLSGGEIHRMALARAFLMPASVLILDEPLVAVDCNNALRIKQLIEEQASCKMVIVVTHDISVLQSAKNVFVVDKGKIHCSGTYAEITKNSQIKYSKGVG